MEKPAIIRNISKPPPKWFRITNSVIKYSENFMIGWMMLKGHKEDSFWLLAVKLASSFVRSILRDILSGNEVYSIPEPERQSKAA